jgi:hypothetical protein
MATREYFRKWRAAHPNYFRDYYRNNPDKKAHNYALQKEWNSKNRREYQNLYNQSDSQQLKIKARNDINNGITAGTIIRQFCEIQSCKIIGEAHHSDYNKPLDVMWLCKLHHEDIHHLKQKERII